MKKLISGLLVLIMVIGMTGCLGDDDNNDNGGTTDTVTQAQVEAFWVAFGDQLDVDFESEEEVAGLTIAGDEETAVVTLTGYVAGSYTVTGTITMGESVVINITNIVGAPFTTVTSTFGDEDETAVLVVDGKNFTVTLDDDENEEPTAGEPGYIYRLDGEESEDNLAFELWGDNWGSGSTLADETDATYGEVLKITSGIEDWTINAWALAWGNDPSDFGGETIDISGYTGLSFKIKAPDYSNVTVNIQSATEEAVETAFDLSTGTALSDDWVQMNVDIPSFTDMTWVAILNNQDIEGTALITDIYFEAGE